MSRDNGGTHSETRSSALWGTGNRGGDSRANALWGKGGRGFAAILTVLFVTAIPLAGAGKTHKTAPNLQPSYVDPVLEARAHTTPNMLVNVIIQSVQGFQSADAAFKTEAGQDGNRDREHVNGKYKFVDSIAVTIKAKKVLDLARQPGLTITADSKIKLADITPTSNQVWSTAEALRPFYPDTNKYKSTTPTIAIVDSGVEKNRADFDNGNRVIGEQVITQLLPNSPG